MQALMEVVQAATGHAFDWLFWPVERSPWGALVVSATLLGALAAWLWPALTPRRRLALLSERGRAAGLALWLFADQPGNLARTLTAIVAVSLARLACCLPAVLLLLPLGLLIEPQLAARFARRPLLPGEMAMVEIPYAALATQRGATPTRIGPQFQMKARIAPPAGDEPARERSGQGEWNIVGPLDDVAMGRWVWNVEFVGGAEGSGRTSWSVVPLTLRASEWCFELPLIVARDADSLAALPSGRPPTVFYPARQWKLGPLDFAWWAPFGSIFLASAWGVSRRLRLRESKRPA